MVRFSFSTTGREVVATFAEQVFGKSIAITGPSSGGLGAEIALSLAAGKPRQLFLLGRDLSKIESVIAEIARSSPKTKVQFVKLDLADQASIKAASTEIHEHTKKLDVLINNAAIMALPEMQKTKEGIEAQFGTNHVGHFLLTGLLMDLLRVGGQGRVVSVTSTAYTLSEVRFDDWNFEDGKAYHPWKGYGQSKTANVLFGVGLTQRFKDYGISAFAAHPGVLPTNLTRHADSASFGAAWKLTQEREKVLGKPFQSESGKSLQQGCASILVAALDPTLTKQSGACVRDCVAQDDLPDYATDPASADRLWKLSEKLTGSKFGEA